MGFSIAPPHNPNRSLLFQTKHVLQNHGKKLHAVSTSFAGPVPLPSVRILRLAALVSTLIESLLLKGC